MSIEAIPRTPMPVCGAQFCRGVADRGGLCILHRRGFKLTTKVQDALLEFVNGIRPLSQNDKDIVLAVTIWLTDWACWSLLFLVKKSCLSDRCSLWITEMASKDGHDRELI